MPTRLLPPPAAARRALLVRASSTAPDHGLPGLKASKPRGGDDARIGLAEVPAARAADAVAATAPTAPRVGIGGGVSVRVCTGKSCSKAGSRSLLEAVRRAGALSASACSCRDACKAAPVAELRRAGGGGPKTLLRRASLASLSAAISKLATLDEAGGGGGDGRGGED